MVNRASADDRKTSEREFFIAMIAVMMNVLSPSSDTSITDNDATNACESAAKLALEVHWFSSKMIVGALDSILLTCCAAINWSAGNVDSIVWLDCVVAWMRLLLVCGPMIYNIANDMSLQNGLTDIVPCWFDYKSRGARRWVEYLTIELSKGMISGLLVDQPKIVLQCCWSLSIKSARSKGSLCATSANQICHHLNVTLAQAKKITLYE